MKTWRAKRQIEPSAKQDRFSIVDRVLMFLKIYFDRRLYIDTESQTAKQKIQTR